MWCNVALASEFCDGFKKPYKKGKESYKPELIYDWECKKSGLSKF